ncbi:MAG: metallophosphoesterase [Polyangiaceae bacterium]
MSRGRFHAALALLVGSCVAFPASGASSLQFAKGPFLQKLGPDGVTIRVELDKELPLRIEIRPADGAPDGGSSSIAKSSSAATFHSVAIGGLTPATRYRYTVVVGTERSEGGSFTTAPTNDVRDPFTFTVLGDHRSDEVAHANVVRAVQSAGVGSFLLNTGDLVEDGGSSEDWSTFFTVEGALLRDHCMFAAVGNHELADKAGTRFLRYFTDDVPTGTEPVPPRTRFYSTFRWQNVRFFLLNAFDTFVQGDERTWLEAQLEVASKEAGIDWRIVVLHAGPHSSGPHGGNKRLHEAGIPALLAKKGVDLVFAGHDHLYDRGDAEGLRYVVSGGGGAPLYPIEARDPSSRKAESAYHFVSTRVTPERVELTAKRLDGTILERCGFTKATRWDCDPEPVRKAVATEVSSGATPPTTSGATKSSRCGCRAVGNSTGDRSLPLVVLALAAVLARRRPRPD